MLLMTFNSELVTRSLVIHVFAPWKRTTSLKHLPLCSTYNGKKIILVWSATSKKTSLCSCEWMNRLCIRVLPPFLISVCRYARPRVTESANRQQLSQSTVHPLRYVQREPWETQVREYSFQSKATATYGEERQRKKHRVIKYISCISQSYRRKIAHSCPTTVLPRGCHRSPWQPGFSPQEVQAESPRL